MVKKYEIRASLIGGGGRSTVKVSTCSSGGRDTSGLKLTMSEKCSPSKSL